LRFLNWYHETPLSDAELAELALKLGSDVPYFLIGGTADATGRGETLAPQSDATPMEVLLIKPLFGVRASFAYAEFDRLYAEGKLLAQESPYRNDLAPGVYEAHPDLAEIQEQLLDAGADAAFMCGSGSTMCALCHSPETADQLARLSDFTSHLAIRTAYIGSRDYRLSLESTLLLVDD